MAYSGYLYSLALLLPFVRALQMPTEQMRGAHAPLKEHGIATSLPSFADLAPKIIEILNADCGEACVHVFTSVVDALDLNVSNTTSTSGEVWFSTLKALEEQAMSDAAYGMAMLGDHANSKSESEANFVPTSLLADSRAASKQVQGSTRGGTDVACASDVSCKVAQLLGNKCSYVRQTLLLVYQAVNIVVHTVTVVISVLCGCLYVHNQAVCVLSGIPPMCSLPYNLYNALFAQSVQLWEAVKASTSMCQLQGDVMIAS